MFEKINQQGSILLHSDIAKIREYATNHKVPIIQDEGLVFLIQLIKIKKPLRILEIGTAIGYSAIQMTRFSEAMIDTIERNPEMVQLARDNIKTFHYGDRIFVIEADALELDLTKLKSTYDIIFIDAAKAQYQKFFERFSPLLSEDGIIISDNLAFHGFVYDDQIKSKNIRGLVRKIEQYINWLAQHPNFNSLFFDIGDGMAVSERKSK
ncbi:MAG TPA: O-methyltransferase [Bacilli bacterium]|nr:O-methyltransferase [Bacilli bacterium]